MKTKELSQEERILNYLQKGNRLTPIKALLKFDCMRPIGKDFRPTMQGLGYCYGDGREERKAVCGI